MTFQKFKQELMKAGASIEDVYRLDGEGYFSALDAHIYLVDEALNDEEYYNLLHSAGRQFVIDNLGDLFTF